MNLKMKWKRFEMINTERMENRFKGWQKNIVAKSESHSQRRERERENGLKDLWSLCVCTVFMKYYFPLYNVTLAIWHVHINMNSAVFGL